jgi:hypothetical protein
LRAPPRSERAQGNPAMRPQWDDIAVIQGSILVRIGDVVIARSGETIQ